MSFLPARMRRLLIGGHKAHLEGVIDTLHAEGVVHVEDYVDPTHTTDIGTPLEAGERASELLVQVRGLQKALGCDGAAPAAEPVVPEQVFQQAEAASKATLDAATRLAATLQALEAEAAGLRPLEGLDFELSAIPGLRSVKVYAGTCRSDPTSTVRAAGFPHELQVASGPSGPAVLLIVGTAHAAAAERALAENGFAAATLPDATGTPAARLAAIAAERSHVATRLEAIGQERAALAAQWGARLATAERALAATVEKTQAPLKFAVTQTTFHVEGWVPQSQLARVQAALDQRFGTKLYLEDLGDAPREHPSGDHHRREEHGAEHVAHGQPASVQPDGSGAHEEHHASDPKDEPPIHLENKGLARPYEFMLGLLGKPRYQEIDPTTLMLVFFPLFFGLMVGDLAVGLVIMLVGLWLKKNNIFGIGGPAVGRALVMGGVMAMVVGTFVFGEALGIHFVAPEPGEMSWESILGLHLPYADQAHGLLFKTGHAPVGEHTGLEVAAEAAEHAGGLLGMLAPHSEHHLSLGGLVNLGYYSKIHDIQALLVWSLIIGLVHLVLGFSLGVRNVYVSHGLKLAVQEKVAWLTLLAGAGIAIGGMLAGAALLLWLGVLVVLVSIGLLWAGAQHVLGAGYVAVLEVFGLAGNLLSYTRLAAIGASKAGMALAFSALGFELAGGGLLGWGIYLFGFLIIIPLSILAGGLQSVRLQFVEFFQKFFVGGGRTYVPFGRRAT
jgi:V/A-type H+-transporting ATPase subunit I